MLGTSESSERSSGERSQRFKSRCEGLKTERSPWEDRGKAMTWQETTAELRTRARPRCDMRQLSMLSTDGLPHSQRQHWSPAFWPGSQAHS